MRDRSEAILLMLANQLAESGHFADDQEVEWELRRRDFPNARNVLTEKGVRAKLRSACQEARRGPKERRPEARG